MTAKPIHCHYKKVPICTPRLPNWSHQYQYCIRRLVFGNVNTRKYEHDRSIVTYWKYVDHYWSKSDKNWHTQYEKLVEFFNERMAILSFHEGTCDLG
jgi:hypothetical protein